MYVKVCLVHDEQRIYHNPLPLLITHKLNLCFDNNREDYTVDGQGQKHMATGDDKNSIYCLYTVL